VAEASPHALRLVAQLGTLTPPVQGLVLDWRRHSYRWSALVVTVRIEDGPPVVVQEWVEAERLRPVRSDPNRRGLGAATDQRSLLPGGATRRGENRSAI
jgi:hypothetical protein